MTAWGIAGIWSPERTLHLTAARAEAMDAASGTDDGLGFIRGLPRECVDALVARFGCAIAIVNPDLLFVIGGERTHVAQYTRTRAGHRARRYGACGRSGTRRPRHR
jgi:[acyl-carrier-protein] S-malonyltransferase